MSVGTQRIDLRGLCPLPGSFAQWHWVIRPVMLPSARPEQGPASSDQIPGFHDVLSLEKEETSTDTFMARCSARTSSS